MAGHGHLLSSNISWGQDLLYLKGWLAAHPEARPFHLAFRASFPPEAIGMAFPLPPPGPDARKLNAAAQLAFAAPPGWYAISVDDLRGDTFPIETHCEHFLNLHPSAMAGYSLYIFHLEKPESQTSGIAPTSD